MNEMQWQNLIKVIEVLVLPFAWYTIKTLSAIQKELSELKTVLIGVDGRNGIRSRMIRVERRVEKLALAQAHRHGEDVDEESEDV